MQMAYKDMIEVGLLYFIPDHLHLCALAAVNQKLTVVMLYQLAGWAMP